jgi:peroxiredoxin
MKKIFFCLLLIVSVSELNAQIKKGSLAPEIKLEDVTGQTTSLSSYKGKVVLLDFWASWCMPCRKNNPNLVALYEKFKGEGFEILGVSIDEDNAAWKKAIEKDGLSWKQLVDNAGWNAKSTLDYGVDGIPASFLIDQNGIIKGVNLEKRELEGMVKKLLNAKK